MHKTMHFGVSTSLVASGGTVLGSDLSAWADRWLEVRRGLHIALPPEHPLMPALKGDGTPSQRPLMATEAGAWLRKLLHGSAEQASESLHTA